MNKLLKIFLIITIPIGQLLAQSSSGTIDGEVWTKDISPHVITGNINVEDLVIEPGVTILFNDDYNFKVNGTFIAQGTYSDSIIFEPAEDNPNGWGGIEFDNNSDPASVLHYCRISGTNEQAFDLDEMNPSMSNLTITGNQGNGITFSKNNITLQNCIISQNGLAGIVLTSETDLVLLNCIVSHNRDGILSYDQKDILYLTNTVIVDNSGNGILCASGILEVKNSIIYNNSIEIASQSESTNVDYSCVRGNEIYPGLENLNNDPQFLGGKSYRISATSPCIDKGDPNPVYNDYYFPPSLGANRNDIGVYGGPKASGWFPPIYIVPSQLSFGNVTLDSVKLLSAKIKNYRESIIEVNEITIPETYGGVFKVDQSNLQINVGDSASLAVSFQPDRQDVFSTDIVFRTNNYGDTRLPIAGKGVRSKINVLKNQLDFESVKLGQAHKLDIPILNSGADTLRIFKILTGDSAFVLQDSILQIDPNLTFDTLYVTFIPRFPRLYKDSLIIQCNDPDNQRIALPLFGQGFGPVFTTNEDSLGYGFVNVLEDTIKTLVVRNNGNDELQIEDIQLVLPDSLTGTFILGESVPQPPFTIPANDCTLVPIQFIPQETGGLSGQLLLVSNDFFNRQIEIGLNGYGTAAKMKVDLESIDFGEIAAFTDSTRIVELANEGNIPLVVDSIKLFSNDRSFQLSLTENDFPLEISSNGERQFSVRYSPLTYGLDTTSLTIYSNDPWQNFKTILLQGTGVAAQLAVDPQMLDFYRVPLEQDSIISVEISNNGLVSLIIPKDSLLISGADAVNFSFFVPAQDMIIEPSGSLELDIRFAPQSQGQKQAELKMTSNDPDNLDYSLALTGIGFIQESADIQIDSENTSLQFISGQQAVLSFLIATNSAIDSAVLNIRQGGQQGFQAIRLSQQGATDIWLANVEASLINQRGLEYYLQVEHSFNESFFPAGAEDDPPVLNHIRVQVPQMAFPQKTLSKKYQMISIPISTDGQTLKDMFANNLGDYNPINYRFFDCIDGQDYTEITQMDRALAPGKSFWLITNDSTSLDISNGVSVPTKDSITIGLNAGWNMIASPFPYPIEGDTSIFDKKLSYYDGTGWTFTNIMQPFRGYAIKVDADTMISFKAEEYIPGVNLEKRLDTEREGWTIQLMATANEFHDRYNYAGVSTRAQNGYDKLDYSEPVPIGDYVSLYFVDQSTIEPLAIDMRSDGDTGYLFNFELKSNLSGEKTIEFIPSNLPSDMTWTIVSPQSKINYGQGALIVNSMNAQYQLQVGKAEFITQSTQEYSAVPKQFLLKQNYPNPFNPSTRVGFELPERSTISIEVFNILGQRVKSLIRSRPYEPGYYQVEWDGKNLNNHLVSSGIYFLQLRSEKFRKSIKMLLQR